jgi:propanol-preferring alcohol dehydrogenase
MALAARLELRSRVEHFALADANLALERLRSGAVTGAAALEMPARDSVAGARARP